MPSSFGGLFRKIMLAGSCEPFLVSLSSNAAADFPQRRPMIAQSAFRDTLIAASTNGDATPGPVAVVPVASCD